MGERLDYRDQRAETLRHVVVCGELLTDQFTCLQNARMIADDVAIEAFIIGESHLVRFVRGDVQLAEVCACVKQVHTPPASQIISSSLLSFLKQTTVSVRGLGQYEFRADVQMFETARQQLDDLERAAVPNSVGSLGMVQVFPALAESKDVPKTILVGSYSLATRRVKVETAHSYPNEGRIVFTQTVLSLFSD